MDAAPHEPSGDPAMEKGDVASSLSGEVRTGLMLFGRRLPLFLGLATASVVSLLSTFSSPVSLSSVSPVDLSTMSARPLRYAFFANWDDQSVAVLRKHVQQIDVLVPLWIHLASSDGDIELDDVARQSDVLAFLASLERPPQVTPLINNYLDATWNGPMAAAVLRDAEARATLVENLAAYVRKHHFSGVAVDFEALSTSAIADLEVFMAELHRTFSAFDATVSIVIPLVDADWSLKRFAPYSDAIILTAYDEHFASGEPGPIASEDWLAAGVRARFAEVEPGELVIGIGSYGYDWAPTGEAELYRFDEVVQTAQEHAAKPALDPVSGNPGFSYSSENQHHRVWYLDGVTAYNQIRASLEFAPRGFALWRIGSEDPAIWEIFRQLKDEPTLDVDGLREIVIDDRVHYFGTGELLRFSGYPVAGIRSILLAPVSGKIVASAITTLPRTYQVNRSGERGPKTIALTFDDGPDPAYTPDLLRILESFDVPATFFIVGRQAALYPELILDIVRKGHEVGNHTWSHPNLLHVAREQIDRELRTTQQLIENTTGRSPRLFRPPYAAGLEPQSPSELAPLRIADERDLFTVGMNIDPQDWSEPSADEIVQRVVEGARAGIGNVVLLHDGDGDDAGGDRSQTVAALPQILETLKGEGFEFVRISELIGLSTEDVMPRVEPRPHLDQ
jgi:peptidoglycan/xylan/chitin deacetylase (PgdA/CDA1 family)/spore germination protein YaaH